MNTNLSFKIHIREIPCYLLILSFFFPTRGTILGISFYYVLAIAIFIYLLTIKNKKRYHIPWFITLYGFILVISIFINFNINNWWYYISYILPFVCAFIFIPTRITDRESFQRFIRFIIFLFTIYSVFCIIESITYFNIFDSLTNTKIEEYKFTNEIRFGYVRNRGAVDISINNGMLLCLVLTLVAYNKEIYHSFTLRISYVLIFVASFLSLSRGVWIQLAISQLIIFLAFSEKNKIKTVFSIMILLFLTLLLGSLFSSGFTENIISMVENMVLSILDIFTGSDSANMIGVGHRFLLYGWVFQTVKNNLFWGLGIGTPVSVITTLGYSKVSIEVMWLYIVYQAGLFGLIGFITFQFGTITYLLKKLKSNTVSKRKNINYYALAASIGYFVALFSCSAFEDLSFYYILVALCLSYNKICDKPSLKNMVQ